MRDDIYQLAGKVNVPADKKKEMNEHVLTIMDRCGIRKTVEMSVAGENVTVVAPARPNADGLVLFDYSVFEKRTRKVSKYDMNTCELHTEDRGYAEFGVVMNMIMILQEAYTDGGCYLVKSGKPYDVKMYLYLLQGVLGERITLPGRVRMWEMYLFFRNSEKYENVTYDDIFESFSMDYDELDIEQLLAVYGVDNKKLLLPDKGLISCRAEIKSANSVCLTEYAYRIFCGMNDEEKIAAKSFLAELLNSDFARRKELSAYQDINGVLAELSLYVLPVSLVLAFAQAVRTDFWEIWDSLGAKGYSDIIREDRPRNAGTDFRIWSFFKAIQRENEDEFLEFWDGSNLLLSQNMKACIQCWKEQFRDMGVPSDISAEDLLAEIIRRLKNSCFRYVDQTFAADFIEHGNDSNYQKGLILLKQLLDKGQEYFPELTGEQADEWIIQRTRDRFDSISISALQSLLTNRSQRNKIFGF